MAGLAVLVLAAVASSGWLVLTVARRVLEAAQDAHAAQFGTQAAALLERAGDVNLEISHPVNREALARTVRALQAADALSDVAILDAQGRPILGDAASDGALLSVRSGGGFTVRRPPSLFVYAPLRGPAGVRGTARLELAAAHELTTALRGAGALLIALTLVDCGLVLLFGALFVRRVTGPLEQLSAAALRVSAGELELEPLASPSQGDEIARLTQAFNRMTSSLRAQRDHLVAQEKLATVGRLAAGVAHEVGNPLAAILGYVELLLAQERSPDGAEDRERHEALERIRKETVRISGIVSDLLDYSRPQAGRVEPVDVAEAVEVALSLLAPQARFRGVNLVHRLPADLPRVAASSSRVVQVLLNLLLNAADAMGGTGSVTIVAVPAGAHVTLRVSDVGPGVPAADCARLFDPFFTTKPPGEGTGLGLAISRSIAQAYGGDLTFDASAGPGATFTLALPIWAGDREA